MDNPIKPNCQLSMQSMINNSGTSFRKTRRLIKNALYVLLILSVMTCWCAGAVFAEGNRITAYGSLTSLEDDGTVLIQVSGHTDSYLVGSSIEVVNRQGESCSLDELTLPAGISFEYIITSKGPVIQQITELDR